MTAKFGVDEWVNLLNRDGLWDAHREFMIRSDINCEITDLHLAQTAEVIARTDLFIEALTKKNSGKK